MQVADRGPGDYSKTVEEFARSGAGLIRESISVRYGGRIEEGRRRLEPGYIPPDAPARVLIISYYPNASDLDQPGTPSYDRIRNHLDAWAETGSVDDYRQAYADWLGYLNRIPFHRNRTKPILDEVGLRNEDISWIPFIKVPMPAGSSPGPEIMDCDIDATWAQIRLLHPSIVWIQGKAIADRVRSLVEERITDKILPAQSVSQWDPPAKQSAERSRIASRLREYL